MSEPDKRGKKLDEDFLKWNTVKEESELLSPT